MKFSGVLRACRTAGTIALLSLAAHIPAQSSASAVDGMSWELTTQDGDISIYTRQIEDSPYLAVKATARINAPIADVSKYMGDGDGCVEWRAMCKSSRVIEQVSEHERYVYMVLDLPWPASDRDLVIHSRTHIDTESRTATVDLQSVSSKHPPEDYVRAHTSGKFVIRALGPEQVEFTYIMHTDLGGNLPADAVNARLATSALDDMKGLQRLAEG